MPFQGSNELVVLPYPHPMAEQAYHLNGPSVLQYITGIALYDQCLARIKEIISPNLIIILEAAIIASVKHHHLSICDPSFEIFRRNREVGIPHRVFLPPGGVFIVLKESW